MTRCGFQIIPEDIGGNGIAAHGFCHLDAMAPVCFRDPGGMHFTADDLERFSIQQELTFTERKNMLLLRRGQRCEKHQNREKEHTYFHMTWGIIKPA